ncbi:uncharacterized protein LOC105195418 isoform X2 [Solenopsis invicta]|uniref:uncharacterized protein LOC105195418 isoform X2 n=1 Tax=Solenopsis invicta TaxID=13686 RepID=UPI000E33FA51|nr:uncharacterized protein LOC105195418 isoform X2 [Solenopsis invicta]
MVKCYICWTEHCSSFPRQFHRFPVDAKRQEQWFQSIGKTINYKYARICSDHFKEDDYYNCCTPLRITRRFSHTVHSDKKNSIIEMQINSTSNIEANDQNDLMDIKKESMEIHENVSIMDVQQDSTMIVRHDILTDCESPLVKQEKDDTNGRKFSHTIHSDKKSSIIEMQINSTSNIQANDQNDLIDIKEEPMEIHENVSIMDIQQDSTTMIVRHDILTDCESPLVKEEKDNTNGREFSHTIHSDKKSSIIEMQINSTSNIQTNNQNDLMDIQQESTVIHENVPIMDVQQDSTTTIVRDDILTDCECASPLGKEEKDDTNGNRKQCNISKMTKMFVRTGKYNIECFKQTDFINTQLWIKFARYVKYNRYVHKLLLAQKKRLDKNITTMKSILQTLKHENLVTNN